MEREAGTGWEMYCARAEDILPVLAPVYSLLLTDPPYGQNFVSGYSARPFEGDTAAERAAVYKVLSLACSRFARACQHLYVFGEWDLAQVSSVFKQATLIWDKDRPGMGDLDEPWGTSWEPVQFAVGHKTTRTRSEALLRKRRGTVLRHVPVTGTRASRHPTEKPVPLLRELLEMSSAFGDSVLDPYAGSGSTGVAAMLEGRRFTGIEVMPGHFATAVARLRKAEAVVTGTRGL
jgi:DNA modification methylase